MFQQGSAYENPSADKFGPIRDSPIGMMLVEEIEFVN